MKSALSVLECHLLRSTFGLECFLDIAFPADGSEVLILVFEENKVVSAVDFLLSDRRLGGFGAAVSGAGDWDVLCQYFLVKILLVQAVWRVWCQVSRLTWMWYCLTPKVSLNSLGWLGERSLYNLAYD